MANVEKYVSLQKLRYRDRVSFEMELTKESENCMMPSFLLQPIVGNAIFHGIEAKCEAWMIVSASRIEDDIIYLSVSDDGVGMPLEKVIQLQESFEWEDYNKHAAIGMCNVVHRIRMHFGMEYGIEIKSELGIGTCVILCMPVMKKQEGDSFV